MFWNKNLEKELSEAKIEIRVLKQENSSFKLVIQELPRFRLENNNLKEENLKLKSKIRTQTEADLFLECSKIQKNLLDGKTKEEISQQTFIRDTLFQQLSHQQQNQLSHQQNSVSPYRRTII
ncbi:MAG: hypothetical protein AABY22_34465 [Nanoarchaeota archaeon]